MVSGACRQSLYSRAVVSELLRNTLKNMNMIWPPLEVDADEMRRQLDTL